MPRPRAFREPSTQATALAKTELLHVLALLRRMYWSDKIQLSFQITIYNLAEKPRHSCIREYVHVGFCLVIPGPGQREKGPRSSGPPAFRLQGGLPSLDTTRSRTDTYTRPSACNHPPRSPSFPRMTFRLSCCAAEPRVRCTPPVGPDGRAKICPFRPLVDDYILRESLSIINARKSCTYAQVCMQYTSTSRISNLLLYKERQAPSNYDIYWIRFQKLILFEKLY